MMYIGKKHNKIPTLQTYVLLVFRQYRKKVIIDAVNGLCINLKRIVRGPI